MMTVPPEGLPLDPVTFWRQTRCPGGFPTALRQLAGSAESRQVLAGMGKSAIRCYLEAGTQIRVMQTNQTAHVFPR